MTVDEYKIYKKKKFAISLINENNQVVHKQVYEKPPTHALNYVFPMNELYSARKPQKTSD